MATSKSAVLTDKTVLFSDALDRTRYVRPLEPDTGQDRVKCAVFFSRSKKNRRSGNGPSVKEYAGIISLPASLFGNEQYGFVLYDEEKEAAIAREIVERDERRLLASSRRDNRDA